MTSNKKILIIVGIVLLLICGAIAAFFALTYSAYSSVKDQVSEQSKESESQEGLPCIVQVDKNGRKVSVSGALNSTGTCIESKK